jgi:N-acetylglucosaminyldiphosphoundecaprenol N-acetyl-beta-D-mannosaminyltransferase
MNCETLAASPGTRWRPPLSDLPRVNILGVGINAIDMDAALHLVQAAIEHGQRGYICVTGVHGVMEAQADPAFKRIQNASLFTTPDGMPMVWVGRLQGHKQIARVYGPDFMFAVCQLSERTGYTHFFYGGKPGVAQNLSAALHARLPKLNVVGTYTPPFRPLRAKEEADLYELVAGAKPDLFWVGLSTPKQERFMAEYIHRLPVKLMVGVGAAFDIHTGRLQDSPGWVKQAGLQWFHRLLQEPSRLWPRYLINNPKFLYGTCLQLLGIRTPPLIGVAECTLPRGAIDPRL